MSENTKGSLEVDIEDSILNSKEENTHPFTDKLQHLPEVIAFIQRLQDCIYRQRNLLLKLYTNLKEKKYCKSIEENCCDKSTQTCEETVTSDKSWQQSLKGTENIVEQIKEAAEDAMQQTGFVYEATSGMYYDYNTGYYYNAELGLYYDGDKGAYYYYDKISETFQFHSQVGCLKQPENETYETPNPLVKTTHDENEHDDNSLEDRAKRKNLQDESNKRNIEALISGVSELAISSQRRCALGNNNCCLVVNDSKKTKICDTEDLEDGECSDSSEDMNEEEKQPLIEEITNLEIQLNNVSKSDKVPEISSDDESACAWPPCLRIIVQETEVKGLTVGTLFIVTCTGGTMGREGDHAVTIPDLSISKHHAKFSFSENDGLYQIVDLGSRNGTYIDGERMSVALRESELKELKHGSVIRVGSTNLLCHVHNGRETCEQCEPGCNQLKTKENCIEESRESKEERHRSELRRLRKRFGLDKLTPKEAVVSLAPGYQDRADSRRKAVGSSDHNAKTQVASVHEPIQNENKGFKMLTKMGWNKGQSLGKDSTKGVTEPILVEQRADRVGLGSDETNLPALDPKSKQKNEIWKKTKKRYQELK